MKKRRGLSRRSVMRVPRTLCGCFSKADALDSPSFLTGALNRTYDKYLSPATAGQNSTGSIESLESLSEPRSSRSSQGISHVMCNPDIDMYCGIIEPYHFDMNLYDSLADHPCVCQTEQCQCECHECQEINTTAVNNNNDEDDDDKINAGRFNIQTHNHNDLTPVESPMYEPEDAMNSIVGEKGKWATVNSNTIIVEPEIHNCDSPGMVISKSDTVGTRKEGVMSTMQLKESNTRSRNPFRTSASMDLVSNAKQSQSAGSQSNRGKMIRSQSDTAGNLKSEKSVARNEGRARITKPSSWGLGLLGGNKRSASANNGSLPRNRGDKGTQNGISSNVSNGTSNGIINGISNGISNGVSNGINGIPPPAPGHKSKGKRPPLLKRSGKGYSRSLSTDSSTQSSQEGSTSAQDGSASTQGSGSTQHSAEGSSSNKSSTVDSGIGGDLYNIDGLLDLDLMCLAVHQDFYNGMYTVRRLFEWLRGKTC